MPSSIKLCGVSAFEFWHRERMGSTCPALPLHLVLEQQLFDHRQCARINTLQGDDPAASQIGELLAGPLRYLTPPLHVLVSSREKRRPSHACVCHVCSTPLPRGSLVKVDNGIYVSSPAFCFLQLAKYLSIVELIQLGDELCGAYLPSEFSETGTIRCPPLTTPLSIRAFVERATGWSGSQKALRALNHVVYGSASPMETALEMVLCLPVMLGGNGIPAPNMNHCIDMAHAVQHPEDGDLCMGDLVWPSARLDVEYNSDVVHRSNEARKRDSLRRNRLVSAGYEVIDAFDTYIKTPGGTDVLVGQILKHLGRQANRRRHTGDWETRASELRRLVYPPTPIACLRVLETANAGRAHAEATQALHASRDR